MDSYEFVSELFCWNSIEEHIELEETNCHLHFSCDPARDQSSNLMSMLWPSDLNASFDQSTMEEEQIAASFIRVDDPNQFEGLVSPNEENSDDCDFWNAGLEGRFKKKGPLSSAVDKPGKNLRSKKKKKGSEAGDKEEGSCCSSEEDELNGSQESNGGSASCPSKRSTALNITGKARAERGAATDPQSLYARKRRERINERLKILQNLVPNGTKVDISTMLEEAVQYVKFLQLQIKLLSSDELWKYAPLAYNGMNIGFDLMIPATKQ